LLQSIPCCIRPSQGCSHSPRKACKTLCGRINWIGWVVIVPFLQTGGRAASML
jgi:hypothetical protein